METLEFLLLGGFQVRRGGAVLAEGGGRPQALLAMLLLEANAPVSAAKLAAAVWGEHPPASAVNLVQGYVSHWRGLLEPGRPRRASGDRLMSAPGGYRLRVEPDECDLHRFKSGAGEAKQAVELGDLYRARRLLRSALREWRGPALADFTCPLLADEASRLCDVWLNLVVAAAEVELRLGRPERALAHVGALSEDVALREQVASVKMLALYRLGRQAEALRVFDETRRVLARELGVRPAPELAQLHLDILREVPSLRGPEHVAPATPRLPARLSSFVGREDLRAEVVDLFEDYRLVTLTGPAGSGKTRLAVEAAASVAASGDRQVHFVDLSPIDDAASLWATVAGVLDRPPPVTRDPEGALAMLPREPVLLVLDNMEQVSGAAESLARVLAGAPLLAVLATSREVLGVRGEKLVCVPPLELPDPTGHADAVQQMRAPAVRLFVERVQDLEPGFRVAHPDVAVVVGICRRLDGLPLALELAAPWTRTLSLRALLERLDQPMSLLEATDRGSDHPSRHRTLRAAIDWSFSALPVTHRRLVQQLSTFRSGASLPGVEAVSDLGEDTVAALAELTTRNLVYRSGTQAEPRYRLLEIIRHYAGERLAEDPRVWAACRDRHTRYICRLGEAVARSAGTPDAPSLVRQLDVEQEEVRAALTHLVSTGSSTQALMLVVDCLSLWWDLGHTREGYERLVAALEAAEGTAPEELLAAGHIAGVYLADALGDHDTGLEHGARATLLAHRCGAELLEALALCLHGNTGYWLDCATPATQHINDLERAHAIALTAQNADSRWGWSRRGAVLTTTTLVLGNVLRYRDAARARRYVESFLDDPDRPSDPHTESFVVRDAGALRADRGDWESAEELLTRSLALAVQAGSRRSESRSLEELARLARSRGDHRVAADFAGRALRLARETGHRLNWARCAALAADIALDMGEVDHAAIVLDDGWTDGGPDPELTRLAPRRARLARLSGQGGAAVQHLSAAAALETAPGLSPDRTAYLVEAVLLAEVPDRARELAQTLVRDAADVGITLPVAILEEVAQVRRPTSPGGPTPV